MLEHVAGMGRSPTLPCTCLLSGVSGDASSAISCRTVERGTATILAAAACTMIKQAAPNNTAHRAMWKAPTCAKACCRLHSDRLAPLSTQPATNGIRWGVSATERAAYTQVESRCQVAQQFTLMGYTFSCFTVTGMIPASITRTLKLQLITLYAYGLGEQRGRCLQCRSKGSPVAGSRA